MRWFIRYGRQLLYAAFASYAIALLFGGAVRADTISFNLTTGNTAIAGYSGPYATVQVTWFSATPNIANVKFTGLSNAGNFYLLGDGSTAAVNTNGASTTSAMNGSNSHSGFTAGGPWSDAGSGNVSQFGVFSNTVNTFDGFTHSSDVVTFTLTKNSGSWTSVNNVLAQNPGGSVAAAHIYVWDGKYKSNGDLTGALATGFAGNGAIVPLPSTASMGLILFAGIAGLGIVRRLRHGPAIML